MHRAYPHPLDSDVPDFHFGDENDFHNFPQQNAAPPACTEPSRDEVADAIARRVLAERDEAMQRISAAEHALHDVGAQRNVAIAAAEQAEHMLREVALERDEVACELEMTQVLLSDSAARGARACRRVAELEKVVAQLLAAMPEASPRVAPPAKEADDDSAFGLSRTKEAVKKAVAEAAKLPLDERRKTLKKLRLKWHPDKHDVLKELAEEVSKMINEAVDEADLGGGDEAKQA